MPVLENGVVTLQQGQDCERRNAIIRWIAETDFSAQQTDFMAKRQKGTGEWFLGSEQFREWINGPNKDIFCPGIPGAGKTLMAAVTINHLIETRRSDDIGVAYIYCHYKTTAGQTLINLLAIILKQLVRGRASISESVSCLYQRHVELGTKPSLQEISSTLRSVTQEYATVYIVVDALDECPDIRTELVDEIRQFQGEANVRLMATSRPIPEVKEQFIAAQMLEVRASEDDVKKYVAGQMCRLPKCVKNNQELQLKIVERIVELVDGMLVSITLVHSFFCSLLF